MQERMIAQSLRGDGADDSPGRAAFAPVTSSGFDEAAAPGRGGVQVGTASPGAHLQGYSSRRIVGGGR